MSTRQPTITSPPPSFDPRRNPMGVRGVMYNATHREASIVMVQPSVPPFAA